MCRPSPLPTIHLLRLPPYRPELNPVEHVRDHLRENYMSNRVFNSLDAVVNQLCTGLHNLHHQPEHLGSMTCFDCFKHYL